MSITISPSDYTSNPVILNAATTSNVTYTVTAGAGVNGVTYSLTGQDAGKFTVTYATVQNDPNQQATLVLNSAANINTQILYKLNLVATDVDDSSITGSRAIGIFVSSSATDATAKVLTAITTANDLTSAIPELDTTTKAIYPIIQTNENDELQIVASFQNDGNGMTGGNFNIDVERISGTNYITLVRKTNADGGVANSETAIVKLTYTGSGHGNMNNDATPVSIADPSYTSADMTLTVTYTPVQIDFYEAAYGDGSAAVERESGNNIAAAGAVVDYYDGSVAGANAGTVTIGASTATKSFPIFLNQQCTWSFGGTDAANFSVFSDASLTTAIVSGTTKAVTGYVKFDPVTATNYATKNEYTTTLTVTDGGASGNANTTGSRTLPIKVVVSTDNTAPVINDISFNGVAYAGSITASAAAFDFDEVSAATTVAQFTLDTTKHGVNDPITDAQYYLVATGTAAGGTATSLAVPSVAGGNSATFTITVADDGSDRIGTLAVDANGISFDNNYDNTDNNVYKLAVFANDSGNGGYNSSTPIELTITVRNTAGMKYTGQDGSQTIAAVIANGVVTNNGKTNASIIQFDFVANIPTTEPPAAGTDTAANLGITLVAAAATPPDQIALASNVVVTDIDHPLASMDSAAQVKRFVFSVEGMTSGTEYTLTMPALTPAASHQNVAGDLPAAGGMVDGTSTFVFTYDESSDKILFHGPESVSWARGHPYTEIFYAAAENMSATVTSNYGAKHNGETGNKMSYYNAVDPTAPAGTNGYFTWTVTNAAGGQTSRTRLVTIKDDADYAGNTPRGPPDLKQDATWNLTFAGSGATAAQPNALDYTTLKETASPTTNAAGDPLTVTRTTELSLNDRGTLWAYATPGQPANATFDEIYQVSNEDVYAYNFAANNTTWSEKSAEWAAGTAGATVADPGAVASNTSQSGRSTNPRTNWDSDTTTDGNGDLIYLGDIRGERTVTMTEADGHKIDIALAGLDISETIDQLFTLQAVQTFDATVDTFDDHAECNLKMSKTSFNQIFYYKPESPGISTSGGDSVWTNLISGPSLRSESIILLQDETNWPVMKSGNAAGTTVATANSAIELHGLIPDLTGKSPFEAGVPITANVGDIASTVVENWSYDMFKVKAMADIFSTTDAMKTEIRNYLTSPGAGVATTTTFEGSIRNKIAELNFDNATELERTTGENDPQLATATNDGINSRPAQFLLYALRDKIDQQDSSAHYRLTTRPGGMFHASNKVTANGNTKDFFPFIWQAGDKITIGTTFNHAPVDGGQLFNGTASLTLDPLPFKFVITLV